MKIRIALAAFLLAAAGLGAPLAAQSDPDCRDARTRELREMLKEEER